MKNIIKRKDLILIIVILIIVGIGLGAKSLFSQKGGEVTIKVDGKEYGTYSLNEDEDVYYLALISTNRYDDASIFYLGKGKDSAVQTLKDLLELHKSMEKGGFATFTINVEKRKIKYSVSKFDMFNFSIHDNDIAGTIYLATSEIKNLIAKLTDEQSE